MPDETFIPELKGFIAREVLNGKDDGLDAATPLIEWGVIDSITIVMLRDFVAARFGVEIPHAELKPSNLANLATIASLIGRLQERPAVLRTT
jgi:acyl carrier protein